MEDQDQRSFALREYLRVIWRRRWLVVAVFIVFVAVAMVVSFALRPKYQASAQLRYQREPDISSAINGTTPIVSTADAQQQLDTTATLMTTNEVARAAATQMGLSSSAQIDATISASPVKDTSLLTITATSTSPQHSADVANAYAEALVAMRKSASLAQFARVRDILTKKIAQYRTPEQRREPAYGALVYRLQDVLTLQGMASGDFAIASVAQVPTRPSSPDHKRDLAVAVILGAILAIASAFVAEQLDVRVHEADDLADGLKLPIIGRIPPVSREIARGSTLTVAQDPGGLPAEAFRMLRGNLDFVDVDHEVSSLIVTSPTAREGKTSTACNLAITLARVGKRVIVIDGDLRRPRAHTYFGLANDVGLSTVVAGRAELSDALQPVVVSAVEESGRAPDAGDSASADGATRLHVLTAGPLPPNPGDIVISQRFETVVKDLTTRADLIILDAPPFLVVGDAAALAQRVDGVLLVMRMGRATRSMVKETRSFLAKLPARKLGLVVTNVGGEMGYYQGEYRQRKAKTASASDSASQA